MFPSRLAIARVLPSEEKATASTWLCGDWLNREAGSGFWSVCALFQVAVDQMIAVPSRLPLAISFPSLEKSRETQKPLCPLKRRISRRVATSQTFKGLGEGSAVNKCFAPKPATRY